MEFLMTYGWAILIFAIVIIALIKIGLFGNSLAPRAQPGNCYVSQTISGGMLQGTCNGELPEFVAQFSGQTSGDVQTGTLSEPASGTITLWVDVSSITTTYPLLAGYAGAGSTADIFEQANTGDPYLQIAPAAAVAASHLAVNGWTFVAGTWSQSGSNTNLQTYINGVVSGSNALYSGVAGGSFYLAMDSGSSIDFNGMLANVQIYNASLPASDIQALYMEGIGGAPIDTDYLTGWWPLNGNTNDYSGYNNNGVPTSITYSSSWVSAYTQP